LETALKKIIARIPAHIRSVWGKPPLLRHEDPEVYWQLAGTIGRDVGPTSIIEWLEVKDVVDLTWDIIRLRQYKSLMVQAGCDEPDDSDEGTGADDETETDGELETDGESEVDAAPAGDTESDKDSHEGSEPDLKQAEVDFDPAEGKAVEVFLHQLDNWERIDRLIISAEIRRASVLRELERQRSTWGKRLRKASDAALGGVEEAKAPRIGNMRREDANYDEPVDLQALVRGKT
jgi:hypothetical protein